MRPTTVREVRGDAGAPPVGDRRRGTWLVGHSMTAVRERAWSGWFKRLGLVGVLFFFIKGLLWLAVPVLLAGLGAR